jgi:N-terminal region of micro-spherule protein/FHA domain
MDGPPPLEPGVANPSSLPEGQYQATQQAQQALQAQFQAHAPLGLTAGSPPMGNPPLGYAPMGMPVGPPMGYPVGYPHPHPAQMQHAMPPQQMMYVHPGVVYSQMAPQAAPLPHQMQQQHHQQLQRPQPPQEPVIVDIASDSPVDEPIPEPKPQALKHHCPCGRSFSVPQAKAAHCRVCKVYQDSRPADYVPRKRPSSQSAPKREPVTATTTQKSTSSSSSGRRQSSRQVIPKKFLDYDEISQSGGSKPRASLAARREALAAATAASEAAAASASSQSSGPGLSRAGGSARAPDQQAWLPSDDLLLISAAQQYPTIDEIARHTRFSAPFSAADVRRHWKAELHAWQTAMASRTVNSLPATALPPVAYSHAEDETLAEAVAAYVETHAPKDSSEEPPLSVFAEVLRKKRPIFHSTRTARALQAHWGRRRRTISSLTGTKRKVSQKLTSSDDPTKRARIALYEGQQIEALERKLLVDEASTVVDTSFLATLRGRNLVQRMETKEILLGRTSLSSQVDVDLTREVGSSSESAAIASRISRHQAVIYLKRSGEFFIKRIGQSRVLVDGAPVLVGQRIRLLDRSLLTFGGLPGRQGISLIFEINRKFIARLHHFAVTGSGGFSAVTDPASL